MLFLIVIIILIVVLIRKWKLKRFEEVYRNIKSGLPSYPFIGHAYLFFGNGVDQMNGLITLGRDSLNNKGLTSGWLGSKLYIVATDPVVTEFILKSNLEKDDLIRFLRNVTGNGSVFAPVSIWRPRRKMVAPTFNLKNLNNFVKVFSHHSTVMVEKLRETIGKRSVSVWPYLTACTLDSVCETMMDVKINSQQSSMVPFSQSIEKCCNLMVDRILQPWLHPDALYQLLPVYKELLKHKNFLWKFINDAITSCRKSINANKEANENYTKSFLKLLIESSSDDSGYSDLELCEEALVLTLAGNDTSATASCFVTAMMARYPDIQEKVFAELQDILGDSDRPVTAEDLPHLKYLEAVIKETLRLYPPVPVIVRAIEKDIQLPSGQTLIEGCGVLIHIWAIHRNPAYWGNDAEQYRPERFEDAPPTHPAAFIPFSHGPRGCLGYKYAMMSIKTTMATLLRRYRILKVDNKGDIIETPLKVSFEMVMKDADGYQVRLEERGSNK